jgi:hypothetical protein
MQHVSIIIISILLLSVVVVLVMGLITMIRNKPDHEAASNRLMRWRIGLQCAAIVALLIIGALSSHH